MAPRQWIRQCKGCTGNAIIHWRSLLSPQASAARLLTALVKHDMHAGWPDLTPHTRCAVHRKSLFNGCVHTSTFWHIGKAHQDNSYKWSDITIKWCGQHNVCPGSGRHNIKRGIWERGMTIFLPSRSGTVAASGGDNKRQKLAPQIELRRLRSLVEVSGWLWGGAWQRS